MKKVIRYRSGYKYQLAEKYEAQTKIMPKVPIDTKFVALTRGGMLTARSGYAWDGTSGPVPDTDENMRASLEHDALYQLMRRGLLPRSNRRAADRLFRETCRKDGVPRIVANVYYAVLRKLGSPAADPSNQKEVHEAP